MYLRIATVSLLLTLLAAPLTKAADTNFPTREVRYHIHPGDVVTVSYRYTPEYNTTVSVQPDGYVNLPLLGDCKLADLTLTEARQQLLTKAGERLNNPELNIDLKEFEKPYYIVGGEVGTPGKFEIRGPMTALRAIEIAGGVKSSGKSSQVLLIRPVDSTTAQTKLIDIKKIIDKHELQEDIDLRPGDMLIVTKTRLAKVEPYIKLVNAGFYLNPLGY